MGKRNRQGRQSSKGRVKSQTTWICRGITVLLTIGVIIAAAFFLLHGKQPGPNRLSPPVTKESNATPETKAGFDRLKGRWLRPDGGYVLEIGEIDAVGKWWPHISIPGLLTFPGGSREGRDNNQSIHRIAGHELSRVHLYPDL